MSYRDSDDSNFSRHGMGRDADDMRLTSAVTTRATAAKTIAAAALAVTGRGSRTAMTAATAMSKNAMARNVTASTA